MNLIVDEIPFLFGFKGNEVPSLPSAAVSAPLPGPSIHRNYVPRVFKSYIWAFYKMIKMTTKILIIIMMTNKVIIIVIMIT